MRAVGPSGHHSPDGDEDHRAAGRPEAPRADPVSRTLVTPDDDRARGSLNPTGIRGGGGMARRHAETCQVMVHGAGGLRMVACPAAARHLSASIPPSAPSLRHLRLRSRSDLAAGRQRLTTDVGRSAVYSPQTRRDRVELTTSRAWQPPPSRYRTDGVHPDASFKPRPQAVANTSSGPTQTRPGRHQTAAYPRSDLIELPDYESKPRNHTRGLRRFPRCGGCPPMGR